MLASVATAFATTIEQFSLRRIDRAVEVDFAVRGTVPRWHLRSHNQELWLDLEDSRVTASMERAAAPLFFPLMHVSMLDFGSGRARLVIRVRGQVDYVVAETPRELIVRVAPSGQDSDLAQPLLTEIERSRRSSTIRAAPAGLGEPSRLNQNPRMTEGSRTRIGANNVKAVALPTAPSAVPRPELALSANPHLGVPPDSNGEPPYGQQQVQTVQPVTRHIPTGRWFGQNGSWPVVAIDAGHGGFDPGTESASGVAEKTVALEIARRVASALEVRGIAAELTRNDDNFLSLPERTEIANRAHADLFVSIHLNSSPDLNTRGIETYYLNNTTDRATIRLARIENGGDYGASGQSNLNYILTNLRQDYKAHESSSLARMIENDSTASIDITQGTRVKALGAKMGPFYVLVGAEMPSILIECGFLSNPQEAQFLIQSGYQQALADGIARAIVNYFSADAAAGNL
jgi:N-acetylmuramoyl-L-alanine amidase